MYRIVLTPLQGVNESSKIEVFDANGKLVISTKLIDNSTIDLSAFQNGIYLLKFIQNNNTETIKVNILK